MASFVNGAPQEGWRLPQGRVAMQVLLQAHECAQDTVCDPWDFAIEVAALKEAGLKETDLRWLLKKQFVQHRVEATADGDEVRSFLAHGSVKFSGSSCFVLTAEGESFAQLLLHPNAVASGGHKPPEQTSAARTTSTPEATFVDGETLGKPLVTASMLSLANGHSHEGAPSLPLLLMGASARSSPAIVPSDANETLAPRWDDQRKELWYGRTLIKRFRFHSPNQEMLLQTFEEESWPPHIDDPLPPVPNQTCKQRLHDAIKNLNRHHLVKVIRFKGDGTGEGVRWEEVGK